MPSGDAMLVREMAGRGGVSLDRGAEGIEHPEPMFVPVARLCDHRRLAEAPRRGGGTRRRDRCGRRLWRRALLARLEELETRGGVALAGPGGTGADGPLELPGFGHVLLSRPHGPSPRLDAVDQETKHRTRGLSEPLCPDQAMRGMAARGWAMGRRRTEDATRRPPGSSVSRAA